MRTYLFLLTLLCTAAGFSQQASIDSANKRFLEKAADARMMDAAQGALAVKKAANDDVRAYGGLMVRDQELLLGELQKLAGTKGVNLPENISKKKAKALAQLEKKSGKDFDRKFLRMMKIDHKRDVREFESAMESQDAAVATFAEKFLPLIREHLEKVKVLLDKV